MKELKKIGKGLYGENELKKMDKRIERFLNPRKANKGANTPGNLLIVCKAAQAICKIAMVDNEEDMEVIAGLVNEAILAATDGEGLFCETGSDDGDVPDACRMA